VKDFQTGVTAEKFVFLKTVFLLKDSSILECGWRHSYRRFEDIVTLQNAGKYSPNNTALQSRRLESPKMHISMEHNKLIYLIYLSTAIGLTPGGSGTVHTINTYTIGQHK